MDMNQRQYTFTQDSGKVIRLYTQEEIDRSHNKERERTGIGVDLSGCRTFRDVLSETGTDWKVRKEPVFLGNGRQVENNFAIVRDMDDKILSSRTVTEQFTPFQNRDFLDIGQGLMDQGIMPVKGGAYYGGRKVWYEFDLGDADVMHDQHHRHILLTNAHDGSGSVMIAVILVRIICSNAMNFAMKNVSYKWAYIHKGQIGDKVAAAKDAILHSDQYFAAYKQEADRLQKEELTTGDVKSLIDMLLPYSKNPTPKQIAAVNEKRSRLADIYYHKPDLTGFGDTQYRFINAVSDYTSHPQLKRNNDSAKEHAQDRIMSGDPMLQKAYRLLAA